MIADPGGGINAAVAAGLAHARAAAPEAFAAALTGDLAALRPADLAQAFALAEAAATSAGAQVLNARTGSNRAEFRTCARAARVRARPRGFRNHDGRVRAGRRRSDAFRHRVVPQRTRPRATVALAVPAESSLRLDIDDADDLERARLLGLGDATRAVLARRVTPRSSDPATRPAHAPGAGRGRAR